MVHAQILMIVTIKCDVAIIICDIIIIQCDVDTIQFFYILHLNN
jgi:hypothetical protein